MKSLFLAAILAASLSAFAGRAKTANKTETFAVNGACGMCEVTIEKAAKLPSVAKAEWDVEAKTLTVTYNPQKVTVQDIQRSVAAKGYDTELYTAPDAAYKALHECCQYSGKRAE